jgi:hypothetical protein
MLIIMLITMSFSQLSFFPVSETVVLFMNIVLLQVVFLSSVFVRHCFPVFTRLAMRDVEYSLSRWQQALLKIQSMSAERAKNEIFSPNFNLLMSFIVI